MLLALDLPIESLSLVFGKATGSVLLVRFVRARFGVALNVGNKL